LSLKSGKYSVTWIREMKASSKALTRLIVGLCVTTKGPYP
jgi:hypothetical protein